MLLLSLGSDVLVTLLQTGAGRGCSGPDLTWLLFGPDREFALEDNTAEAPIQAA